MKAKINISLNYAEGYIEKGLSKRDLTLEDLKETITEIFTEYIEENLDVDTKGNSLIGYSVNVDMN